MINEINLKIIDHIKNFSRGTALIFMYIYRYILLNSLSADEVKC